MGGFRIPLRMPPTALLRTRADGVPSWLSVRCRLRLPSLPFLAAGREGSAGPRGGGRAPALSRLLWPAPPPSESGEGPAGPWPPGPSDAEARGSMCARVARLRFARRAPARGGTSRSSTLTECRRLSARSRARRMAAVRVCGRGPARPGPVGVGPRRGRPGSRSRGRGSLCGSPPARGWLLARLSAGLGRRWKSRWMPRGPPVVGAASCGSRGLRGFSRVCLEGGRYGVAGVAGPPLVCGGVIPRVFLAARRCAPEASLREDSAVASSLTRLRRPWCLPWSLRAAPLPAATPSLPPFLCADAVATPSPAVPGARPGVAVGVRWRTVPRCADAGVARWGGG